MNTIKSTLIITVFATMAILAVNLESAMAQNATTNANATDFLGEVTNTTGAENTDNAAMNITSGEIVTNGTGNVTDITQQTQQ